MKENRESKRKDGDETKERRGERKRSEGKEREDLVEK